MAQRMSHEKRTNIERIAKNELSIRDISHVPCEQQQQKEQQSKNSPICGEKNNSDCIEIHNNK